MRSENHAAPPPLVERRETLNELSRDRDRLEKYLLRPDQDRAIRGTVYDHRAEVGFECGFAHEFIDSAFVVLIAHSVDS
jgi:hypothetical protein